MKSSGLCGFKYDQGVALIIAMIMIVMPFLMLLLRSFFACSYCML